MPANDSPFHSGHLSRSVQVAEAPALDEAGWLPLTWSDGQKTSRTGKNGRVEDPLKEETHAARWGLMRGYSL